jgi:hypothetical protein
MYYVCLNLASQQHFSISALQHVSFGGERLELVVLSA